VVLVLSK